MFTMFSSVVNKTRASRSAASALSRPRSKNIIPSPLPVHPSPLRNFPSRDTIPSELDEVSANCDGADNKMLVDPCALYDMFKGDSEDDSLEDTETHEPCADLHIPEKSYDHEDLDEFTLWLAVSEVFDGENPGGEKADSYVSEVQGENNDNGDIDFAQAISALASINAEDADVVFKEVNPTRSVTIVESEDLYAADEEKAHVDDSLTLADIYEVDYLLILATLAAAKSQSKHEVTSVIEPNAHRTVSIVDAEDTYAAHEQTAEVIYGTVLTSSGSATHREPESQVPVSHSLQRVRTIVRMKGLAIAQRRALRT